MISYLVLYFSKLSSFFTLFEWKSFYKVLYIILNTLYWTNNSRRSPMVKFPTRLSQPVWTFLAHWELHSKKKSRGVDFHDHTCTMRSCTRGLIFPSDFGFRGQISAFLVSFKLGSINSPFLRQRYKDLKFLSS